MRVRHRKTLIREEKWPLIEDWYYCPESVVEARIELTEEEWGEELKSLGMGYEFFRWERAQRSIGGRLAHKCKNGNIRAPSYIERYDRKSGGYSLYGKCSGCETQLSEAIKTIIMMEDL
jgi:hypothetical protein